MAGGVFSVYIIEKVQRDQKKKLFSKCAFYSFPLLLFYLHNHRSVIALRSKLLKEGAAVNYERYFHS